MGRFFVPWEVSMGGHPALGVGLDEAWDRATPDQVKAYGASFVCRYLSEDNTGKNLTRSEAEQLSAAGLWIVSNYEYHPGNALKGYWEGRRVARLADQQHRACGGPAGRPIYFSVDIDTNGPAVAGYFRGIADEIGLARTGCYGEYEVVKYLFDNGLIIWGWQTYAWSHGQWDGRAQIRQVANGISVAGHDVDRDENYAADYGQWMIGGNTTVGTLDGTQGLQLANTEALLSALAYDLPTIEGLNNGTRQVSAANKLHEHLVAIDKTLAELRNRPAPGTVVVTDEQLERVLRRVMGSVDGSSPAV